MKTSFVSFAAGGLLMALGAVAPSADAQTADGHHGGKALPPPAENTDFLNPGPQVVALGRMLFFDKILSGNRNISCATCHSPVIATTDGLSINIGAGGRGLGILRDAGTLPLDPFDPRSRGSRNMQQLFNLGHKSFTKLFWDGRVQVDPTVPSGFDTPASADLPIGFSSALEAISLFAETDMQEMTGETGTNELANANAAEGRTGVWKGLLARLRAIPEYIDLFTAAFPEVARDPSRMTILQVGKAIGGFQAVAFRSDNSPFDRYLRGDRGAMSPRQKEGMRLFYGKAKCATCHSGTFQTDNDFYDIGIPQIGPGFNGAGFAGREDFGRESTTGDPRDRYRFRVPSLRNVALTGPWGHDGFYNSLKGIIQHHLDPETALFNADPSQRVLPSRPDLDELDLTAFNESTVTWAIASRIEINPQILSDAEVDQVIGFLIALTDPSAGDLRKAIPARVPSNLPMAEIRLP